MKEVVGGLPSGTLSSLDKYHSAYILSPMRSPFPHTFFTITGSLPHIYTWLQEILTEHAQLFACD